MISSESAACLFGEILLRRLIVFIACSDALCAKGHPALNSPKSTVVLVYVEMTTAASAALYTFGNVMKPGCTERHGRRATNSLLSTTSWPLSEIPLDLMDASVVLLLLLLLSHDAFKSWLRRNSASPRIELASQSSVGTSNSLSMCSHFDSFGNPLLFIL